jgi:hypothetical protein
MTPALRRRPRHRGDSKGKNPRQKALPKPICDIAWKAHLGLTSRFRTLVARGKAKPKVATAVARELTGFIWTIAREVPAPPA